MAQALQSGPGRYPAAGALAAALARISHHNWLHGVFDSQYI